MLLAITVAVFLSHLFDPDEWCGNQVSSTIASPDGSLRYILYERDCGAVDSQFHTHVCVVESSASKPDSLRDVFVADGDNNVPLFENYIIGIEVQWTDSKHLHISYDEDASMWNIGSRAYGIDLTYEALPLQKVREKAKPELRPATPEP